jgi:hypothetical protein
MQEGFLPTGHDTLNSLEYIALTFFMAYSSFNGCLSLYITSLKHIFFSWLKPLAPNLVGLRPRLRNFIHFAVTRWDRETTFDRNGHGDMVYERPVSASLVLKNIEVEERLIYIEAKEPHRA